MNLLPRLISLCFICILSCGYVNSQSSNFEWVRQMGGSDFEIGTSIATDYNGDVFISGRFQDTVDFDPGVGISNLIGSTTDSTANIFIQKLDSNGNFLWARGIEGNYKFTTARITVDNAGNIYLLGSYQGLIDLDPGITSDFRTSTGNYDIFLLKIDSAGSLIWSKVIEVNSNLPSGSIITDINDNVYFTGLFRNSVDFDPGTGAHILNAPSGGGFIEKLNSSGNLVWVKQFDTGIIWGSKIEIDIFGNLCLTGSFENTVDFNPGIGVSNLSSLGKLDCFIQKLDSNGVLIWVKQIGGLGDEYGTSVSTDLLGNVYTTGIFENAVDFDPGTAVHNLTAVGQTDGFIQKMDSNGNFLWVNKIGGSSYDYARSNSINNNGNIYVIGEFRSPVLDFGPGQSIHNLNSLGGQYNIFILAYDSQGNIIWSEVKGGNGVINYGSSITTDLFGNIYSTGCFRDSVFFELGNINSLRVSTGNKADAFVLKLNQLKLPTSLSNFPSSQQMLVYPNPTDGMIVIKSNEFKNNTIIRLFSISGQLLQKRQIQGLNLLQFQINQPFGIYMLEIETEEGNKHNIKIIKN